MIKTKRIKKTIESVTYGFYCDKCEKYLGESEKCSDGYFLSKGAFDINLYIPPLGRRYEIHKYVCDECKNKLIESLRRGFKELGFSETAGGV